MFEMYGMSKKDIDKAYAKVERNIRYMSINGINVDNQFIPYANFVNNAYINSNRYIAEINNRVNSLYQYADSRDLACVFVTLTLPTAFHPTLTLKNGQRVTNRKYGGRDILFRSQHPITKQKIKFYNPDEIKDQFSPKNGSKYLSNQLTRLYDDRFWKSIPKDDRVFFRVTEPHKDGTPHVHACYFIPKYAIEKFVAVINRLYPEPMSKVHTDVYNPVGYLMKYILKTFDDLRNSNDNLTALTLWYIHHGISRIYTSRTLIDLTTYRKLKGQYSMIELTKKYNDGSISVLVSTDTLKIMQIFNEHGPIYDAKIIRTNQNFEDQETLEDSLNYKRASIMHADRRQLQQYHQTIIQIDPRYIDDQIQSHKRYDQLITDYSTIDISLHPDEYDSIQNVLFDAGIIEIQAYGGPYEF